MSTCVSCRQPARPDQHYCPGCSSFNGSVSSLGLKEEKGARSLMLPVGVGLLLVFLLAALAVQLVMSGAAGLAATW